MNRLKLNFSIDTIEERTEFLHNYLNSINFSLTPEEKETCANYILWGKERDGKNLVQKKEISIETKNKTWSRKNEEESLDALLETPTFNEQIILSPSSPPLKVKKETFNREEALLKAPAPLKEKFSELFLEIDSLDLLLNYYDIKSGKRKTPPRSELLSRFSDEEKEKLELRAKSLNPFQYLKLRHLLVEKRREQFSLRDSYSEPLQSILPQPQSHPEFLTFDYDIPVYPLGVFQKKDQTSKKLFSDFHNLDPKSFSEKELASISQIYWSRNKKENPLFFDFRELEHVYQLFLSYYDIEDSAQIPQVEGLSQELLDTLNFYISMADLTPIHHDILSLKIKKYPNQKIADIINEKYSRSYTVNYISTIFRQQIIKKINEAAELHYLVIGNIFFPENFKTCARCGRTLLLDSNFFMRKGRAKDGFSNRCKSCEREIRGGKKKEETK